MSNDSPNRRIFLQKIVALSTALAIPNLAKSENKKQQGRIAIVYYSRTLHTQILAMYLQGRLGADLYRIHTEQDYPSDYQAMVKQVALEQKENYKPKLKEDLVLLNSYDILFVGTPLWSLSISSPIRTLLAKANLEGKKIAPFITNAGYKFGRALKDIESLTNADILQAFEMQFAKLEKTDKHLKQFNENLLINGTAFNLLPQKKIESWLLDLKIL